MDPQRYIDAGLRTAEYFVTHLDAAGKLLGEDVEEDPAFYYKLPALLYQTGKTSEAKAVLQYIEKTFLTPDGDVRASAEQKTRNGALRMYSIYINGWLAKAAIMMKQQDVLNKLRGFYSGNKSDGQGASCGGWFTDKVGGDLDFLTTAHFGSIALMEGDMTTATSAADFLQRSIITQQDSKDIMYTRIDPDGKPITTFPDDMAVFNTVKASEPNQLYFFLGYPLAFLAQMYGETQQASYLAAAEKILQFLLQCDQTIYSFHFAHKVAWGASIVAAITKKAEYVAMGSKIADYLLSLQGENGLFLNDGDAMDKYDQSAEIAQWLREIGQNLAKVGE